MVTNAGIPPQYFESCQKAHASLKPVILFENESEECEIPIEEFDSDVPITSDQLSPLLDNEDFNDLENEINYEHILDSTKDDSDIDQDQPEPANENGKGESDRGNTVGDPPHSEQEQSNTDQDVGIQKRKKLNERKYNQEQRMKGKSYKSKSRGNVTVTRKPREMGDGCNRVHRRKSYTCANISEKQREDIFNEFWNEMDWKQRRVYVGTLVDWAPKKKSNVDTSRRNYTYEYHLCIDGHSEEVC